MLMAAPSAGWGANERALGRANQTSRAPCSWRHHPQDGAPMSAVAAAVALGLAVLAVLVLAARSAGFSRATRERLEREVERVSAERDVARRETTRLVRALDAVPHGVVVW